MGLGSPKTPYMKSPAATSVSHGPLKIQNSLACARLIYQSLFLSKILVKYRNLQGFRSSDATK